MYKKFKTLLPEPLKKGLKKVRLLFLNEFVKRKLYKKMTFKHQKLINKIKQQDKIKVVFLVIHHSVWKVDNIFKCMQKDSRFYPVILICPHVSYNDDIMLDQLSTAYDFFERKNYPVVSSLVSEPSSSFNWLELKDLQPDLIFFTNPHNLTRQEYYADAYMNYLTCYVPYHHEVGLYDGNQTQYNHAFHNALWKIFVPHECSRDTYKKYCASKDFNVEVTGYPACEDFYNNKSLNVWKSQNIKKLKIIWAPHHTINSEVLPYSNFLEYEENFVRLINDTKDLVQWAFKPHPLLKSNLYLHPNWGKEKTDRYYQFWSENSNSQLEEGEYVALFQQSDAMIHDSGSFLAEYIYLKKPVLYTVRTKNYQDYYNDFGLSALSSIKIGEKWDEIIQFVNNIVAGKEKITLEHHRFIQKHIAPYYDNTKPSEIIINSIKTWLQKNER